MLFSLCAIPVSSVNSTTLFINDRQWEVDSLLPFIESGGKMLIPAHAFAKMSNIKVTVSDTLGSLLIQNENGYLSYNLSFGTYLDEKGNLSNTEIYRYGGEIYLEPDAICKKFGIVFESAFAPDGYLAARISDGSQLMTFDALLDAYSDDGQKDIPYLYNPTGKTLSGTFVHPILLVPSPSNVEPAIELLGTHRSTFALAPSEIEKYADVLPLIYVAGHSVAYYMDYITDTDPAAFREAMEKANNYLFSITGKTSRIYVSAAEFQAVPQIEGFFPKSCNMHLVVDDLRSDKLLSLTLYDSPLSGTFNFSLASDIDTRKHYEYFFRRFDSYEGLGSMPLTESCSNQ